MGIPNTFVMPIFLLFTYRLIASPQTKAAITTPLRAQFNAKAASNRSSYLPYYIVMPLLANNAVGGPDSIALRFLTNQNERASTPVLSSRLRDEFYQSDNILSGLASLPTTTGGSVPD